MFFKENVKLCAHIYFIFLAQFTSKIYFSFSLVFSTNSLFRGIFYLRLLLQFRNLWVSFQLEFFAKLNRLMIKQWCHKHFRNQKVKTIPVFKNYKISLSDFWVLGMLAKWFSSTLTFISQFQHTNNPPMRRLSAYVREISLRRWSYSSARWQSGEERY